MRFADQFDALHEAAMAETGLSDFGESVYREGLIQLLAARDARGSFCGAVRGDSKLDSRGRPDNLAILDKHLEGGFSCAIRFSYCRQLCLRQFR